VRKYIHSDRPYYVEKNRPVHRSQFTTELCSIQRKQEWSTQNQQHQGGLLVKHVMRFRKEE